jgi:hypothetical protein
MLFDDVDWTHLAHDRVQWRSLVSTEGFETFLAAAVD